MFGRGRRTAPLWVCATDHCDHAGYAGDTDNGRTRSDRREPPFSGMFGIPPAKDGHRPGRKFVPGGMRDAKDVLLIAWLLLSAAG